MFEVCVGVFWPSMSTMRSKYIPESSTSPTGDSSALNDRDMIIIMHCVAVAFSALTLFVGRQEEMPQNPETLSSLASLKPDWFCLSGTGSPG